MMKRDQFKFFQELRIRYAEVDSQGIVFNAHYLTYFDTAITEYMRNINYDYHTLVSRRGLDFHLIKSTVEYLKPIGFDEIIEDKIKKAGSDIDPACTSLSVTRYFLNYFLTL
jgi:acyl-CoA thioester hydrolase